MIQNLLLSTLLGIANSHESPIEDIGTDWMYPKNFQSWSNPCDVTSNKNKPFCDTSKSFEDRAHDLVYTQEAGLKDYANVYMGLSGNGALPVNELSIPGYQWWSEALHGVANSPGVNYNGLIKNTTMFPQVITTASSFNDSLFNIIGTHISTEGRAMWNNRQAGLTFWAPNINIFRDPRWGRGQETPGEDPFLNSRYAGNFVSGMQNGNNKYIKASSCCKHYADYSMESADGYNRHDFNALVSEYDQNDTYLVAFKACAVDGDASGIMCSYNAENGIPSCANYNLLTTTMRNTYNFNGYITSDCGAVSNVQNNHHYTSTTGATINATYGAGMDLDCGSYSQKYVASAINSKATPLATIQASIFRATLVQMRLGLFDPPDSTPWSKLSVNDVCTPEALGVSHSAAQQGMVLLKNDKDSLPLSGTPSIALIGPNADNTNVMKGNYAGTPPFITSVRAGLDKVVGSSKVTYAQGCAIDSTDKSGFTAAINAAKAADVTIMVMGIDNSQEAEGHDRSSLSLPGVQYDLISQVSSAAKGKVILVILSGGCVDISAAKNSSNIDAIIWGGYPGMYGGDAISDVIFGKFNPTGRLTQTWYYAKYTSEVEMVEMRMRPNNTKDKYGTSPGRGYRYYPGDVIYKFGDGMSYTTFSCGTPSMNGNEISVKISNTGNRDGGAVIIVYFVPDGAGSNGKEIKRMIAYGRANMISKGSDETVTMKIYKQFYDGEMKNTKGNYVLGGACA